MKTRVKLEIFLPESHIDAIRDALGRLDVGRIGSYGFCSSAYPVTGTWLPLAGAQPYQGTIGELSRAREWKLEMVCPRDAVGDALAEIRRLHPYEEPVVHVLPLLDPDQWQPGAAG